MERQKLFNNFPLRKGHAVFFANFFSVFLLLFLLWYPLLGELPVKGDNNDILWQTVIGDMSDTLWMRGAFSPHYGVTFHPSSNFVAGATSDLEGLLEVFSVPEGKRIKTYSSSGKAPIYFLKNGTLLAFYWQNDKSPYNVELRIVDFETDSIVFRRSGSPPFTISPDERTIAIGIDDNVYLYDIETGQLLRTSPNINPNVDGVVTSMAFLSKGREIFVAIYVYAHFNSRYEYYLWNLETNTITPTDRIPLAVSPDGTREAYGGGGPGRLITILDAETKEEIGYIPNEGIEYAPSGGNVAFSPDGRYLLYTFEDGDPHPYHIYIWDLERKELVYVMPRKKLGGYSCAFSPDG